MPPSEQKQPNLMIPHFLIVLMATSITGAGFGYYSVPLPQTGVIVISTMVGYIFGLKIVKQYLGETA